MRKFLNPPMPEQYVMTAGLVVLWSPLMGVLDHELGGDPIPLAIACAFVGMLATLASFAGEFGSARSSHRFYGSLLVVTSIHGMVIEHAQPGVLLDHVAASVVLSSSLGAGLSLLAFGSSARSSCGEPSIWRLRPALATFETVAGAFCITLMHWGWKQLL